MNEKNVDWNDLQLFLAVAQEGGLSPAARKTNRSAATLGRRMREFERVIGRELFVRHDRGYEMTTEARKLFNDLVGIEARISRLTVGPHETKRPLVKVSAGTWTTMVLLEKLDDITGTPADIRLRFVSAENIFDISHREIAIGFRNQRPIEESLAGRKLSRVEFAPYAGDQGVSRHAFSALAG